MVKRSFKFSLWPALGTLLGTLLLVGLGSWQVSRFAERSAIEETREARLTHDPVVLESASGLSRENAFTRVRAQGELDHSRNVLFKFRNYESRPGNWLATPLVFEDGSALLVNRGWVTMEEGRDLALEDASRPRRSVKFEGILHIPERILSDDETRSSTDDVGDELTEWSKFDVDGVYDAMPYTRPTVPAVLVVEEHGEAEVLRDDVIVPSSDHITRPYLTSEKHLGYAITWYTLAVSLVLLYIAAGFGFVSSRPRRRA